MIIECTSCHSRYQYDEGRLEGKTSKKIKCARCQAVFEIFNPAAGAPPPAAAAPPPAPAPKSDSDVGDRTSVRRHVRLKTVEEPLAAPAPVEDAAQVPLEMPEGKRLSLAIINGPDAGSVHRLSKPRTTIGRQDADVTLNDTDASRQHAVVEVRGRSYTLVDLQSTNGTLVNGERIDGSVDLQNHSEFQVGSSTLMLIVTDDL